MRAAAAAAFVVLALAASGCGSGVGRVESGPADTSKGKALFIERCGACHTLKEANGTGTVGPNLDEALKGKDAAFIHESIVDPNKEIAAGYPKDLMPGNFGTSLSPKQIDDLVALLSQAANG